MGKRLVLSSLLLGALGGVAFADDQPSDPMAVPVGGAADPAAGTATGGAPPVADGTPAARWPKGVIDRPLTLPAGLGLAGADVIIYTKVVDPSSTTGGTTVGVAPDIALGYGVTDDFEINTLTPTYAFPATPDGSIKGPLDAGIGYKLLRGALDGKLEVIARAVIGYDIEAEYFRPLRIGLQAQYNATPKIAILSHDTGLGNAGIGIFVDGPAGVDKPVYLTLPVGVAYQATPELWIEADTSIFSTINISNTTTNSISDVTPLAVTGIYNTLDGHLDLLGYFSFGDLQHAGDTISFGVGFRYYPGKV